MLASPSADAHDGEHSIERYARDLQQWSQRGISSAALPKVYDRMRRLRTLLDAHAKDALEPMLVRARTLLAEYYDYTGQFGAAAEVLQGYSRDVALRHAEALPRLALWIGNERYRARDFQGAADLYAEALRGYEKKNDPFGMGFAYFFQARREARLGNSLKALSLGDDAISMFDRATGTTTSFRVGICQVLLAWIAYWDDNWPLAERYLKNAELSFAATDCTDPVHLGRIAFIRGCITRASARTASDYTAANEFFQTAISNFRKADHGPYLAGALNNRALTFIQRWAKNDRTAAERDLAAVKAIATAGRRAGIENLYFTARLMLREGKPEQAADVAHQAAAAAGTAGLGTLQAEALVSAMRAQLILRDALDGARSDDDEAAKRRAAIDASIEGDLQVVRLQVVGRRRRTEVACLLVQTELDSRRHKNSAWVAETSLATARQRMEGLTHAFLSAWFDEVAARVAALRGAFYLGAQRPSLDYRSIHEELKLWLVLGAVGRTRGRTDGPAHRAEVARALGLTRQALERWIKTWQDEQERRSRTPGEDADTARTRAEVLDALQPRKVRGAGAVAARRASKRRA